MVSLECATWELTNLLQFITSVYCARWMTQGFGFQKLLTRKRRLLSILFRNLQSTRTNGRYRFFPRMSGHLDIVSKSLKMFIQFFIGYPNTCMWCGIQAVICSWLYELLMSLRKTKQKSDSGQPWSKGWLDEISAGANEGGIEGNKGSKLWADQWLRLRKMERDCQLLSANQRSRGNIKQHLFVRYVTKIIFRQKSTDIHWWRAMPETSGFYR